MTLCAGLAVTVTLSRFERGDFIEVRPIARHIGTALDFGVIRGTALDTCGYTGLDTFSVGIQVQEPTDNTTPVSYIYLDFNLMDVVVTNLFRAHIARIKDA